MSNVVPSSATVLVLSLPSDAGALLSDRAIRSATVRALLTSRGPGSSSRCLQLPRLASEGDVV